MGRSREASVRRNEIWNRCAPSSNTVKSVLESVNNDVFSIGQRGIQIWYYIILGEVLLTLVSYWDSTDVCTKKLVVRGCQDKQFDYLVQYVNQNAQCYT